MLRILTVLLAATTTLAAPVTKRDDPLEFKIITSNVRYAADESSRFDHEKSWDERKQGQIDTLKSQSQEFPTLIGVEEVLKHQLDDIVAGMNEDSTQYGGAWNYFGVGRDDGKEAGEYAAIMFNSSEWELVNGTSKWLSETPDKPSKSWDAANIRIVSIAEFSHKPTGRHINYLNTHFDHKSELARKNAAELIVGWIDQIPNDFETYLSGDFNSQDTDDSYKTLSQSLADTRQIAKDKQSTLPTYTGFEPDDAQTVIDFIWAPKNANSPDGSTSVDTYNVIDTMTSEGFRFSDHRPVTTKFTLK